MNLLVFPALYQEFLHLLAAVRRGHPVERGVEFRLEMTATAEEFFAFLVHRPSQRIREVILRRIFSGRDTLCFEIQAPVCRDGSQGQMELQGDGGKFLLYGRIKIRPMVGKRDLHRAVFIQNDVSRIIGCRHFCSNDAPPDHGIAQWLFIAPEPACPIHQHRLLSCIHVPAVHLGYRSPGLAARYSNGTSPAGFPTRRSSGDNSR